MPWYFLSWVLGSDIYLYQETLYLSISCKRLHPAVLQGWPLKLVQHIVDAKYSCSTIACRSTWLLTCAFAPPFCLSFNLGMPNRSRILELKKNQCLVCNFLCMPRCESKIALKKTRCLSCFTRNFRNILTPFQVVSDSKSKVFGGSNLFQILLM